MKALGYVYSAQVKDNQRLNLEQEDKQQLIETLRNVSSSQAEEIRRLNLVLENKQKMIETLGNASTAQLEESHRPNRENERLRLKIRPGNTLCRSTFVVSEKLVECDMYIRP